MHSPRKKTILSFLHALRQKIMIAFEAFEPSARFEKKQWVHHAGGGGEIGLIRGAVFEKAAVNWSGVTGHHLPMNEREGPFFATGISLITHMANPKVPTVHMNIRYIETATRFWFGGGYDLTPMGFFFKADRDHFHSTAQRTLDRHDPALYRTFSTNAKHYFYIKHWQKERGVGGIFFDDYNTGDFNKDFAMWQDVGNSFLPATLPIYRRRIDETFTEQDKATQNALRAHYVEFNLLYDRGTRFGFTSGGNPEAILCSMPPSATW
ncbi:MAG: oxygen-dependent coproporphyrinogen oxidase [Chlamydiota bacterium]